METALFVCLLLLTSFCVSSAFVFVNGKSSAAATDGLHFRSELDTQWIDYIKTYNKSYSDKAEMLWRRMTWEKNIEKIVQHNMEAVFGYHTYTMGINQFTDMTFDEFSDIYLSRNHIPETPLETAPEDVSVDLPSSVDWRTKDAVTPVKNQGKCGSCWAFSTTGAIEGQVAITEKKLVSLSEQNLIDCSKNGNEGCNGGLPSIAYKYVMKAGIDLESCYPYQGKASYTCHFKTSCVGARLKGFKNVPKGETNLKQASATKGPISVGIAATENLMHYSRGIFSDPTCKSEPMNHAVLVVGYSGDTGGYWIIKNSWGTTWGMKGYVNFAKDKNNMCHVSDMATYPIIQ